MSRIADFFKDDNWLVRVDNWCDDHGLASPINNAGDLALKLLIKLHIWKGPEDPDKPSGAKDRFYTHIKKKDAGECGLFLVPIFGRIIVAKNRPSPFIKVDSLDDASHTADATPHPKAALLQKLCQDSDVSPIYPVFLDEKIANSFNERAGKINEQLDHEHQKVLPNSWYLQPIGREKNELQFAIFLVDEKGVVTLAPITGFNYDETKGEYKDINGNYHKTPTEA
jgi:hypothetical protein